MLLGREKILPSAKIFPLAIAVPAQFFQWACTIKLWINALRHQWSWSVPSLSALASTRAAVCLVCQHAKVHQQLKLLVTFWRNACRPSWPSTFFTGFYAPAHNGKLVDQVVRGCPSVLHNILGGCTHVFFLLSCPFWYSVRYHLWQGPQFMSELWSTLAWSCGEHYCILASG